MKKVGIFLLVCQAISIFGLLMSGYGIFGNGFFNTLGRFAFAIVGVILLIIGNRRGK